jgi:hypothetical protein
MGLGSGSVDPGSEIRDPEVKKAPDPGSVTVTCVHQVWDLLYDADSTFNKFRIRFRNCQPPTITEIRYIFNADIQRIPDPQH